MKGFLQTYADFDLQQPLDAAVVVPTTLRPCLVKALHSVFAQKFDGRVHIMIGIDHPENDLDLIEAACAVRPANCAVQIFWPGYSTSVRHGGLTPPGDGGALRATLTYLANSPYVAYLDDDNWWGPEHLLHLRRAIDDAEWAFALRWFVHPETGHPVCIDIWESVGPGLGLFKDNFGGFVDPSCLMINKVACPLAPHHWNFPLKQDIMSADRNMFAFLSRNHKWRGTGRPSVFYSLNVKDGLHPMRLRLMGSAYDDAAATLAAQADP